MKLYYAPYSPYVRKVRVVAAEHDLADRIELVPSDTWEVPPDLYQANPLGKVPTLLGDDGETIYDSPVICEYLDALGGGKKLFPADGAGRWRALRAQALGDGIMDAAVELVVERFRAPEKRSPEWQVRQRSAIERALAALAARRDKLADIDIGTISIAVALSYLEFRFPADRWLAPHPELGAWFLDFSRRPSMVATRLKDWEERIG
jgi:glutathione S-transferase